MQQYVYGNYLDEVWTRDDRRNGVTIAQLNDGTGSERVFCHSNTMYSVSGVTDETGALKEAYQYDAYGRHTRITDGPDPDAVVNFTWDDVRVVGARSTLTVPQSFTGQRFDPETGLQYYKSRYYSSTLERFLSRDPAEDEANLYAYGGGNPLRGLDPLGQFKIPGLPITVPAPEFCGSLTVDASGVVTAITRKATDFLGVGCVGYTDARIRDKVAKSFSGFPKTTASECSAGKKCCGLTFTLYTATFNYTNTFYGDKTGDPVAPEDAWCVLTTTVSITLTITGMAGTCK